MPATTLPVAPSTRAVDLCLDVDLSDDARQLLQEEFTADQYFAVLTEGKHFFDAIRVLARAMPEPVAVRWASACVRTTFVGRAPADSELVAVAEQWVLDPTEENRIAAQEAAEASRYQTAAAWVAAAAGWSDATDEVEAPEVPSDAPVQHSTARAAAGAIGIAAAAEEKEIEQRAQAFLERGLKLAHQSVPRR